MERPESDPSTQEPSQGESAPTERMGQEQSPAEPPPSAAAAAPRRKTVDERKELLGRTIQTQVAGGGRVESQGDFQAVVIRGHRPNHLLHFIIGLVTLSLWWIFVWLPLAIFGGEKRSMLNVDEFGNVTVQKM